MEHTNEKAHGNKSAQVSGSLFGLVLCKIVVM